MYIIAILLVPAVALVTTQFVWAVREREGILKSIGTFATFEAWLAYGTLVAAFFTLFLIWLAYQNLLGFAETIEQQDAHICFLQEQARSDQARRDSEERVERATMLCQWISDELRIALTPIDATNPGQEYFVPYSRLHQALRERADSFSPNYPDPSQFIMQIWGNNRLQGHTSGMLVLDHFIHSLLSCTCELLDIHSEPLFTEVSLLGLRPVEPPPVKITRSLIDRTFSPALWYTVMAVSHIKKNHRAQELLDRLRIPSLFAPPEETPPLYLALFPDTARSLFVGNPIHRIHDQKAVFYFHIDSTSHYWIYGTERNRSRKGWHPVSESEFSQCNPRPFSEKS